MSTLKINRKRRRSSTVETHFIPVVRYLYSNLLSVINLDMSILQVYLRVMTITDRRKLLRLIAPYTETKAKVYKDDLTGNVEVEYNLADIIDDMWRDKHCKLSPSKTIRFLITVWDSTPRYTSETRPYPRQFETLKTMFNLDEIDLSIISLLYFYHSSAMLDPVFNSDSNSHNNELAAAALNIPTSELMKRIDSSGSIGASGLLTTTEAHDITSKRVIDQIQQVIFSKNGKNKLSLFTSPDLSDYYSPSSFTVNPIDTDIVSRLLASGRRSHILLHGKPGSGKTEYARSIARSTGKRVLSLRSAKNEDNESRCSNLLLGIIQAQRERAILIADEVDILLNTEQMFSLASPDKGWLINLIENYDVHMIWITNTIRDAHEAVLRRFNYSIEFKINDRDKRLQQWQSILKHHSAANILPENAFIDLAHRYEANPGVIEKALSSLVRIIGKRKYTADSACTLLETLLKRHLYLTGGTIHDQRKNHNQYRLGALNTSMPVERIITAANGFQQGRVKESITVLLHGVSGTGKSAFAGHVAEQTGMPLISKRASDLLSMYVGGTEANLRAAFQEAQERSGILLIDEVDTFLASRTGAEHSWERTQVNELLTGMEEYKGVFFCTTNLKNILDTAVLRRFVFRVEFYPLDLEGRIELFLTYFPEVIEETGTAGITAQLERLPLLTPGDYRAVHHRMQLSGFIDPNPQDIIKELAAEVAVKKNTDSRQIGFTGAA